jgi:ATP-dependent Clp protease adaptor protein ClpS
VANKPDEGQPGTGVVEKTRTDVKRPQLYRVLLHNDDYTTMEFVVMILESVFSKPPAEAYRIMMQVHCNGHGICGVYSYEVAETKVALVHEQAREHGYPLRASMEEE